MTSNEKTLETLLELGHSASRRTRAEQFEEAMRLALMLMDADAVVVLPPASVRGERLALFAGSGTPAVLLPAPNGGEVARGFAQRLQPLLFADLTVDARGAGGDDCPGVEAGPAMFTPLRLRGSSPGYLAIYRRRGRARFTAVDSRQILLLAAWLNTALDLLRFASSAERLAVTDDLTEVYNSRFLGSALKREIRRATRFGQETSIVVIDLDRFKAYKQQHGEQLGNQLLRQVALLLAQQVRSFDLLGRNGGDDFMLILPQTGRDAALLVAERMRQAVEQHAFPDAAPGAITVSLGVASFPQEGADGVALLASAGRALARARQRGMNCVETPIARAA
jgi:diguanylate cyclase (GGDEF)-like protein